LETKRKSFKEQKMSAGPAPKKVLIALDRSEVSRKALDFLMTQFLEKQDDLTLAHAYQGYQHKPGFFKSENLSEEKIKEIQDNMEKKDKEAGEAALQEFSKKLVSQGFKQPRIMILRSPESPKETLCKLTEDEVYTVACVASRGLGAIKRAFLGSTSDYLVHNASCPVFVVKEND